LSDDYRVHTTFNVIDLTPFTSGTDDEADNSNFRTNPLQERGDDEEGLGKV